MNILRFSDLCAQGKARNQRVFIRADLNVPLTPPVTLPKTPASAPRFRASAWPWTRAPP